MGKARFEPREAGFQAVRRAVALGVLNACHAVEARSKELTPVHGDPTQGEQFATFAPGAKPIGGTLRRSQHSAVFLDGRRVAGTDDGDYSPSVGIQGFVGTNVFYAAFVHDGTVFMEARPFLATALMEVGPDIPGYIQSGAAEALRRAG